jgi:S-adenosylmethionine synthetase
VFLSVRGMAEPPCDLAALARRVISEAGYPAGEADGPTVMLDLAVEALPGAGQMTTAFGFACDDTPEMMPLPLAAAHRLAQALDAARASGEASWLSPDAQAQVAVRYRDRKPVDLPAIALATNRRSGVEADRIESWLARDIVPKAFSGLAVAPDNATRLVCQTTDAADGPQGHSGLTGRKTAIDTFGGFARQSAAALSGKSPARVDRIAQYAARAVAQGAVRAGLARNCEVQISYLLGEAAPVTVEVDTFGTGRLSDAAIETRFAEVFDFHPEAIAERFALWDLPRRKGGRFYRDLACYGQMGRIELDAPWEAIEIAALLA